MATPAVTTIRVVEQLRVSPPPGSVPDSSLPLTFFDIIWIFMDPVHRLFLYPFPHSTAHFVDSFLPNLKSSLSLALRDFYPLAGNFIRSDSVVELRYADGDSVSLTVAEYDGSDPDSFEKLSGSDPFDFPKFHQLIPSLPENEVPIPLLALQVTVFPNHGISLGVSVHHAACDGSSSVHFLKSWASACKKSTPSSPPLPVIDRTLIADPDGLYSIFLNYARQSSAGIKKPDDGGGDSPDGELATFTLGGDQIRGMKEFIKERAKSLPYCSTFMVACAYTWVGVLRSRRDLERDRTAAFAFSVDCRSRLSPPIPASYFGNCLCACFAEANVGDLVGEDGLVVASEAIGRAIGELKGGVFEGAWLQKAAPVNPGDWFTIAGSPKFGVYEIDFGWGRPRKVVVPSIPKSRGMSLAESREGGGGVEIGLVLQRDELDKFKTYFSSGQ